MLSIIKIATATSHIRTLNGAKLSSAAAEVCEVASEEIFGLQLFVSML